MLEEPEPLLDGVELRPLRDLARLATTRGQGEGRNFVSLRFWQVRDDQAVRPLYLHRSLAAAQVANALNPNATGDPEFLSVTDLDVESSITVVEAGTFVASNSELTAGDGKPDPLTRCVDVLTEFHRSYRVMTDEHVPELTYERLHPLVVWFRRDASAGDAAPTPAGMLMLENRNYGFPDGSDIGPQTQTQITELNVRLSSGDPFALYAERRLAANVECWTTGRMGESIVQSGIAAELLFDALLGFLMWEEHDRGEATLEAAAEVFSTDITPRLRNQYAKRLGGQWSFQQPPMQGWFTTIASVRNAVVHGGARPDKHAAADAIDALLALEGFVGERLCERWRTYPRTAWTFLGTRGFEKRGRLQAAEKWMDSNGGSIVGWVREYQSWREQVNARVVRRRA